MPRRLAGASDLGEARARLLGRRPSWPSARAWRSPWRRLGRSFVAALAVGAALAALALVGGLGAAVLAGCLGRSRPWRSASAAALAAAASARAVLLSAARALPAAVWAPLALPALPARCGPWRPWRGGLAGRLDDAAAGLDVLATERGVDLAGQARLAAGGGVRVDRAGLGRAVERAQRLGQGGRRIDRRLGRAARPR